MPRTARPPRTYELTERTPAECRLARADVDFLLALHRAHVEVAPAGRPGWYRLTPSGYAGTIVAPTCRLILRPKIPIGNLFHLLDVPDGLAPYANGGIASPEAELFEVLVCRFARLLSERAAAGLQRGYAERETAGPFLQGRLDVHAQLRDSAPDRLHCRFDDFTSDIACNQVPKATAERVLRSPLVSQGVRDALRQVLRAFADVRSIPLEVDSFARVATDRLAEAYRPLLDLCRLLAEGLAPGRATFPAFLLDLERAFEQYLTRGVLRAFAGRDRFTVDVQPLHVVAAPLAGQPDLQMRPDIVVRRAGRPVLVIDAKWKVLGASPLVTADVYQVLAYCTALGSRRALLVYPGRRDRTWTYDVVRGGVRLRIRSVRVVGSREACARSLERLVKVV